MMYCKHCGYKLDDGMISCPNCSTEIGMGDNFCSMCGTPRMSGDNFCSVCGSSFSQTMTQNDYNINSVQPVQQPTAGVNRSVNTTNSSGQGFDFKAYFNEWLDNLKGVLNSSDKLEMLLRYASYAASLPIFILMMFPVISVHLEVVFYEHSGSNLFAVSGFGAMMYIFALLCSLATFLPHVKRFEQNNKKLVPFMYLIVPLMELLGMLSMLIGVGMTNAAVTAYLGDLASVRLGFVGWLILIITLAAVGAAVYHVIKYDLDYMKENNPFVSTVSKPKDSITDAMNNTYNDTVYRGDDIKKR